MDLKQKMAQLKAEERWAEVGVGPGKKSPEKEGGSMGPLRHGEKELRLHDGILPHGCAPPCHRRRVRHGDLQEREDKMR